MEKCERESPWLGQCVPEPTVPTHITSCLFSSKVFFKGTWAGTLIIILLLQQVVPCPFCPRDPFTLDLFWSSAYSLVMPSLNLLPSSRIQTLILGYSACLRCKPSLPTYKSNPDPWGSRVWALHLPRVNFAMHHNFTSNHSLLNLVISYQLLLFFIDMIRVRVLRNVILIHSLKCFYLFMFMYVCV